jgi:hypothetical protein
MGMAAGFNDMNRHVDEQDGEMDPSNRHGILFDVGRKPRAVFNANAHTTTAFLILRDIIVGLVLSAHLIHDE